LANKQCYLYDGNKLASKIIAYQSKDGLQNEKGLEKYIDKILTEKTEKNNNNSNDLISNRGFRREISRVKI